MKDLMLYRNKLSNLQKWKDQASRKPLILRGARQVGKTYLVKEFGKTHFPGVHYFNFEEDRGLESIFASDLKTDRILDDLALHQNKEIGINDLIIFDEIQACPSALTSLKYFCENRQDGFLVAAGSLLGIHLSSSFPVGKVAFLDLHPMNFDEFLLAIGEENLNKKLAAQDKNFSVPGVVHEKLFKLFLTYLVVGGMPEAVQAYADNKTSSVVAFKSVRQIQKDLITSYTNDIAKHSGKLSALNIERVWRSVASQLSLSLDGKAKKFRFKDILSGQKSFRDLSGPIDWLKKAGLVVQVGIANSGQMPSEAYAKENRFKLLMHDSGLLGAMVDLSPEAILGWKFGTYKGYFAENYVAQELTSLGYPLYSWEEGTAEIEFLLAQKDYNIPIEVKAGHIVKAKSLQMFDKKFGPQHSVVISANPCDYSQPSKLRVALYATSWIPIILGL